MFVRLAGVATLGIHQRIAAGLLVIAALLLQPSTPAQSIDPTTQPLVLQTDLTYQGSFRLPAVSNPSAVGAANGFDYATTGVAYNPQRNSLFVNNHIYEQKTAEVSIPALSTNMSALSRGTFLQNFADIAEGKLSRVGAGGAAMDMIYMGGLLVHNNRIVGTSYVFYDAAAAATLSHFSSGLTLAQAGDFKGMFKIGTLNPGFYAGYMASIPAEWQASLGAPALTGQCCLSIISRTSFGPSAFAFNPDSLGVTSPVPATPLVYYPQDHQTLGRWDNQSAVNLYFNMATTVRGAVFPGGTRSVLFFGRQGMGVPCYGEGGATPPAGALHWCPDPVNPYKGNHAYPYKSWVWAYDANELLAVKNGQKNPWDVWPYAIWPLTLPVDNWSGELQGVAFDPATRKIYVSQYAADGRLPGASPYDAAPLIHVFQVGAGSGSGGGTGGGTGGGGTTSAPTITWTNPGDIVYGTALSGTQLNARASVAGTFVYTPASGTRLNAGASQTLSTVFSPTDTTKYSSASASVRINVMKATPVITWPTPADLRQGTPLSAAQLNATASVPGTLVYSPPAGTILSRGADQTLSVTFTPTNTQNYTSAMTQVLIDVRRRP